MMKFYSNNKGFTLIEIIVSIAIFTVVALIAVGALLKVVDANKKSQSLKTSINNVNFALESMSRELRVGSSFVCSFGSGLQSIPYATLPSTLTKGCGTPTGTNWAIAFYSSKTAPYAGGGVCNLIHEYRYNPSSSTGVLEKAEQQSCTDTSVNFSPIISPGITFTTASMYGDVGTGIQSYVFFHLAGYSGVTEKTKTYFDIQTSVSQRLSD